MDRRAEAVAALQRRLDHTFVEPRLLERALTHASVKGSANGPASAEDNERLEFLGDRVLGLIIAQALVDADPAAQAGDLAKRYATLVSRSACARVARDLGLGDALRLPGGESRRGSRDHDTILADACEAVIAALFLELGYLGAADRVLALWAPLLAEPPDAVLDNPRSALQERAAAAGISPPVYRTLSRSGPAHSPLFVVEVALQGGEAARGEGGSLQNAQKAAALALLEGLSHSGALKEYS